MKKCILLFYILSAFVCAHAQQYLRYHMNDNSFNGFYTESIERITHESIAGIPSTCVYSMGMKYEIPLNTIDSISIENTLQGNGMLGNYRLYELTPKDNNVKRVYVDNRSSLIASVKGNFGENDTIIYTSAYKNIKFLLFTDNEGRVKRIFNGDKLLYFDYNTDDDFTILDVSSSDTLHSSSKRVTINAKARATSKSWTKRLTDFIIEHGNEINNMFRDQRMGEMLDFVKNIDNVQNNPELHNQVLIADGIIVASDLAGIIAALLAEAPSMGWSTLELLYELNSLRSDLFDLLNDLFPGTEVMDAYKQYYKNKYSISLKVLPVEDKSFTSARLCGELLSKSKSLPKCTFMLYSIKDDVINGQIANDSEGICKITGNANNLDPGSYYFYYVSCTYEVDGLELTYTSDSYADFYTPMPQIETGSYQNNGPQSTTVYGSCLYDWESYFENLAEPKVGFAYSSDGLNWEFVTSNLGFDGNFSATLDIHCITYYWYKAYVEINGVKHFGQEKQFLSAPPSLDGVWHVVDNNPTTNEPNEYDIYIQGNTATWSRPYKEGGGEGSVRISADGTISIGIMEELSPGPWSSFWRSWGWSGKVNDKDNPTSVTGTASKLVGNSFHDNRTEFPFTMTR